MNPNSYKLNKFLNRSDKSDGLINLRLIFDLSDFICISAKRWNYTNLSDNNISIDLEVLEDKYVSKKIWSIIKKSINIDADRAIGKLFNSSHQNILLKIYNFQYKKKAAVSIDIAVIKEFKLELALEIRRPDRLIIYGNSRIKYLSKFI